MTVSSKIFPNFDFRTRAEVINNQLERKSSVLSTQKHPNTFIF